MPNSFRFLVVAASLLAGVSLPVCAADPAPGLESLQGKWSVTKTNREGASYVQAFEFKQDQFILRITDADGQPRLFAKGKVKAERTGAFATLSFAGIEGGRSADDLQPVEQHRAVVYLLRNSKLYVAAGFDENRENERPSMDVYVRTVAGAASTAPTLPLDEGQLIGTWKVEAISGETPLEYELRFAKADGKLEAALISPRSGEHKFKSVVCQNNELVMELDRELQGQDTTVVYKARRTAEGLVGTFARKGGGEQSITRWTASK
jgi:hypothetical protein